MEPFIVPGDEEIGAAYAQGKETVIALFHRTCDPLVARLQMLEDWISNNSPALPRRPQPAELDQAGGNQPDLYPPTSLSHQDAQPRTQNRRGERVIHQGDIYWVPLKEPDEPEPGYIHPHVVIQADVINLSRINTVVVCALTSNMKRVNLPGNVLLDKGEANLPRQSVVEVSKISTVHKTQFGEYIGSLTKQRVDQILAGMQFLQSLTGPHE